MTPKEVFWTMFSHVTIQKNRDVSPLGLMTGPLDPWKAPMGHQILGIPREFCAFSRWILWQYKKQVACKPWTKVTKCLLKMEVVFRQRIRWLYATNFDYQNQKGFTRTEAEILNAYDERSHMDPSKRTRSFHVFVPNLFRSLFFGGLSWVGFESF